MAVYRSLPHRRACLAADDGKDPYRLPIPSGSRHLPYDAGEWVCGCRLSLRSAANREHHVRGSGRDPLRGESRELRACPCDDGVCHSAATAHGPTRSPGSSDSSGSVIPCTHLTLSYGRSIAFSPYPDLGVVVIAHFSLIEVDHRAYRPTTPRELQLALDTPIIYVIP